MTLSTVRFHHLILLLLLAITFSLAGCSSAPSTPPRVRIASGPPLAWSDEGGEPAEKISKSSNDIYLVQPGDTLWAIAAVHGIEVESLADWNTIQNTDLLRVNQALRLSSPGGQSTPTQEQGVALSKPDVSQSALADPPETTLQPSPQIVAKVVEPVQPLPMPEKGPFAIEVVPEDQPEKPIKITSPQIKPKPRPVAAPVAVAALKKKPSRWSLPSGPPKQWVWPHKGRLISKFGRRGQLRNNGIDIAVQVGDPVRATADGIVAYADSGLPGYGNMILLRHGGSYMTAYGYVNQILVRRGQQIKAGERIALAGQSGHATSPRLHFEIRNRIKPLNPLRYLPSK
ncbi:MAG: peptidoglycan DD-metalloendopeptidase family protein [Magnetococcales bacterium]|nr:peptidoglycan DD-metalloendopeptidase family protein [Magnetococcales bacterium]